MQRAFPARLKQADYRFLPSGQVEREPFPKSRSPRTVLRQPGGGKPVIMRTAEAERLTNRLHEPSTIGVEDKSGATPVRCRY